MASEEDGAGESTCSRTDNSDVRPNSDPSVVKCAKNGSQIKVELKKLVLPADDANGGQTDAEWSRWMLSQRSIWDVDDDVGCNNIEDLLDSDPDGEGLQSHHGALCMLIVMPVPTDVCENGELPPEIFEDDAPLECDE